jgi:hypothetical protein
MAETTYPLNRTGLIYQDHAEVRGGLPGGAVRVGHVAAPTGEGHALAVEHDQQKLGHVPRNLARL